MNMITIVLMICILFAVIGGMLYCAIAIEELRNDIEFNTRIIGIQHELLVKAMNERGRK